MLELNRLYLMDCMDGMREFPDGFFDLAIVDPPYGWGKMQVSDGDSSVMTHKWATRATSRFGGLFSKYKIKAARTGGTWAEKCKSKISHWDIAPDQDYFEELFRVSKNQIIWGGNYFGLPPTRCFIVWRKLTISEEFSMAMCEYAWTSFDDNAKFFEAAPQGKGKRFHPTQKPVSLYRWLLQTYAKPGYKIIDTHAGSASSFVASFEMWFDYIGFEIDEDYHAAASKRIDVAMSQGNLFRMEAGNGE